MNAATEQRAWPVDTMERRAVADLVPYVRNPRKHSDAQVATIAALIQKYGWTNPPLIDETDGILCGHGRILAAQQLGIAEVPVMIARGWSEAEKRAYIIADNQSALTSTWDFDLLRAELDALKMEDFDLKFTGFDDAELAKLLAAPGRTDPDDAPEVQAEVVSRLGDVWLLGVYYLCDCGARNELSDVRGGFRSEAFQLENVQPGMHFGHAAKNAGDNYGEVKSKIGAFGK